MARSGEPAVRTRLKRPVTARLVPDGWPIIRLFISCCCIDLLANGDAGGRHRGAADRQRRTYRCKVLCCLWRPAGRRGCIRVEDRRRTPHDGKFQKLSLRRLGRRDGFAGCVHWSHRRLQYRRQCRTHNALGDHETLVGGARAGQRGVDDRLQSRGVCSGRLDRRRKQRCAGPGLRALSGDRAGRH